MGAGRGAPGPASNGPSARLSLGLDFDWIGQDQPDGSRADPAIPEAVMRQIRAEQARSTRGGTFTRIGRFVAIGLLATLPGGPSRPPACVAQASAPAQAPAADPGRRVADLTTRYRFLERYATASDPTNPEAIV